MKTILLYQHSYKFKNTVLYVLFSILFINTLFGCNTKEIIADESCQEEVPKPYIRLADIDSDSLAYLCSVSSFRGKSVGVFGGSYTIATGSDIVYNSWSSLLSDEIKNYGVSGYGFSSEQGSIQDEVNSCGIHDIYVLWASTNDFNFNRLIGVPSDYTSKDGFDDTKRNTQCGGINYCIYKLREENPQCKLVMLSSSIFFRQKKDMIFQRRMI